MPPTATTPKAEILTRYLPSPQPQVDQAARTVRFAFSSERPVMRWVWLDNLPEGASSQFNEVLPTRADAWNLERVSQKVCPYLDNHNANKRLGAVTGVEFGDEFVYATVKLRKTAECTELLEELNDPDLASGVSFGYTVDQYRVLTPAKYEGEGWERRLVTPATLEAVKVNLYEVSACPIPADPTVGLKSAVSLRSLTIDGDPGWEPLTRATPEELKKGDWVGWNSSGGTSKGRIETVATSGTIQAVPKGPSMECTPENPGYLVVVWKEENGDWMATETKVVKRAGSLTEIAALKKTANPRSDRTMPPRTRKTTIQKREDWTLAASIAEQENWESMEQLWTAYKELLEDVDDADAIDDATKQGYMDQAYADFCKEIGLLTGSSMPAEAAQGMRSAAQTLLNQKRKQTAMPPEPTQPNQGDRPIEDLNARLQLEQLQRDHETLKQQMEAERSYRELSTKCTGLQRRAEVLMRAGKLTPAMFKGLFGTDDDNPVEIYREHLKADPLEFFLKMVEDHGAKIVDFRSIAGSDTLPLHPNDRDPEEKTPEQAKTEAEAILERRKAQGAMK